MVILHAFLALVAGAAAIVLVSVLTSALLRWLVPSWAQPALRPEFSQVVVTVGAGFLAGAAGGLTTAAASDLNPLVHVLALAIVALLLSAMSAMQMRGKQPVWLALVLVAMTPLGVLAGGLVWLRMVGIL